MASPSGNSQKEEKSLLSIVILSAFVNPQLPPVAHLSISSVALPQVSAFTLLFSPLIRCKKGTGCRVLFGTNMGFWAIKVDLTEI